MKLKIYVIDSSNAFQIPITFDEKKRTYLSLPYKYKDWYVQNCPKYPMLKLPPNQLEIPCLRGIQGTKNAGNDWYKLISGLLENLCLYKSPSDNEVFHWMYKGDGKVHPKKSFCVYTIICITTDDLLISSEDEKPIDILRTCFDEIFTYTLQNSNVIIFLNFKIIQSQYGI